MGKWHHDRDDRGEREVAERRHPDHETVGLKQTRGSAENRVAREWLLCQTSTTTTRTIATQAQPDSLTHLLDRHRYHPHTPERQFRYDLFQFHELHGRMLI